MGTSRPRAKDAVDEHVERWTGEIAFLDPLKEEIFTRMAVVTRSVAARRESHGVDAGLAGWQYKTLMMLRRQSYPYEARPADLADVLGITRAALSNRLASLEDLALVERRTADGDRRGVVVRLTGRGAEITETMVAREEEFERRLLSGLPRADQRRLAGLLRRVCDGLAATADPPA